METSRWWHYSYANRSYIYKKNQYNDLFLFNHNPINKYDIYDKYDASGFSEADAF